MIDNPPVAAVYKEVNLVNHLQCIKFARLGPEDPRTMSAYFWLDKALRWKVKEGEARSRLCMNCEEYDDSPEVVEAFNTLEGGTLKAEEVNPSWVTIEGMPTGNCARWNISCSALRTCDDWEPIEKEDVVDPEEE